MPCSKTPSSHIHRQEPLWAVENMELGGELGAEWSCSCVLLAPCSGSSTCNPSVVVIHERSRKQNFLGTLKFSFRKLYISRDRLNSTSTLAYRFRQFHIPGINHLFPSFSVSLKHLKLLKSVRSLSASGHSQASGTAPWVCSITRDNCSEMSTGLEICSVCICWNTWVHLVSRLNELLSH